MGGGAATKEPSRGSSPLIGPKTKEDIESTSTPPPQVKVDYEIGKVYLDGGYLKKVLSSS